MSAGIEKIGIAVIIMCHDGNGKYLVSKRGVGCRDEHGNWEPAGGGAVEFGETLEEAVLREVEEECGTKPFNLERIGFREIFRKENGKKSHWVMFDYKAEIDPKKVYIPEPDKCDELAWVAIDAIPNPMHSQFPAFLEKYKDIL